MNALRQLSEPIERRYRLHRVGAGDYLLPSNDGQKIFRLSSYIDGPSMGLDLSGDRTFWGVWEWTGSGQTCDCSDEAWERWNMVSQLHKTRREAVQEALSK